MIWIVSHDAGGAEILSSWARKNSSQDLAFVLEGPAVRVFQSKLPGLRIQGREAIENLPPDTAFVLTGTGWGSDLETEALRKANAQGIKTIAYIDHWAKYPERFTTERGFHPPDEVWVGDEYALEEAKRHPVLGKILLVPNPYFEDIREEFRRKQELAARSDGRGLRILYICESVSELSAAKEGFSSLVGGDFEAVRRFFDWFSRTHPNQIVESVRLRPHPAEKPDKYDSFADQRETFPVEISRGRSLVDDCVWSDWVIGMTSMALVVGIIGGRKVFSCIPEGWDNWRLPHREIITLRV